MKRLTAVIIILGLLFSAFAEVSRPSLDGRAKVAEVGELPVGLFAKSASFLPGDTVIVTNPATKISIEVMIFGNIGSSEGIAVLLSPEAARELYITKGSNVIVQVTKKSDTYAESSILAKTLQTYQPEEVVTEEDTEPVFDEIEEVEEDYYFYDDPDAVIKEEASELVIDEETVFVDAMDDEVIELETEILPVEPVNEEIPFEEPEWPGEVIEAELEPAEPYDEEIAFDEPEWPAEEIAVEPEPAEPVDEEIPFDEPEWPAEVIDAEIEPAEPENEEIVFDEPEWPDEYNGPVIEYVEIIGEEAEQEEIPVENENFIEETVTVLIPVEPNPPSYESIIEEEPEVVIIPVFEEISEVMEEPEVYEETELEEEPEVEIVITLEDVPEAESPVIEIAEAVPAGEVVIPYGEITAGKWYVQIATCSKLSTVEEIVAKYGKKYPMLVVKLSGGDMRVLIGSLSDDEYPVILARFKSYGFKDSFARNK